MKQKKSLKKRMISGIMSAAMLATSAFSAVAPVMTANAADNDYYQALALSLYFFDSNACGTEVDNGPLAWRGNCHTYDAKAAVGNLDSSLKQYVDPDGDGKVDVSGGFHDAGDHIKFNLTIGFGMSSLAMSEYLNSGVYEKAGCKDHLIYELKHGADYLMKTTFLDGSGNVAAIAHVVADGNVDHSYWTPPEEQTYERPVYWLTASDNNSAVCGEMAAALAGTAYVVKDSDPTYAAECIKYAKALIDFGTKHAGNNTSGLGSFYGTDAQYQDEMALAQAWLYILGEGSKPSYSLTNKGCYNNQYYDYYLYSWDKVWSGYAAMMYKATKDTSFADELLFEVNNKGGMSTSTYNSTGADWGCTRYNCAVQMSALAYANGDKNSSMAQGAKFQMDYILGNNSFNKSFLTGYGSAWSSKVHHRAANPGNGDPSSNPDAKYVNYGYLIGGPDGSGTFNEVTESYRWTEGALDYNGCFALACAGLANLFGGSDKGASKIVSSASEFKSGYSFGSSSTVTPTPSTDEPKTTTAPSQSTTPVQTTKATTTQAPTVVSGQKDATVTEMKDEKGNTYWSFGTSGATKLTVKLKTNSNDTEANGVFNPSGGWNPTDWTATPVNGVITLTYDVPAGQSGVEVRVWWPQTATLESAVLDVQEVQTVATTKATTTTTTTTTTTKATTTTVATTTTAVQTTVATQPTNPSGNVTTYGDVDGDGSISILDVLTLNQYLLGVGGAPKGLANADVNRDGNVADDDAMNILKALVKLVTLPC